jgi:hypothetical protein
VRSGLLGRYGKKRAAGVAVDTLITKEEATTVGYPADFLYAFAKLERAIEELVRAGDIKERLSAASMLLMPIFPDDFPPGPIREEYASIHEALSWLPPEKGSGHGLRESTLDAMTEDEAGALAERLFSVYLNAADVRNRRLYGGG